ncbi:hypothetical protein [uncultured Alistipes sp.]|uniref:hypothetical protein n=1 Tax=uncultured Alistipes sp. TaxID=538949 RepID=UPI0026060556|nr:hypothetical protein [uncultured Alistipes sp.]
MYTSIEKIPSYAPQTPDIAKIKSNVGGQIRQVLTAVLGREFIELSTRHKVYGFYLCISLMALCALDEARIWPNLLNLLNFANAARLTNKAAKKRVPRD